MRFFVLSAILDYLTKVKPTRAYLKYTSVIVFLKAFLKVNKNNAYQ